MFDCAASHAFGQKNTDYFEMLFHHVLTLNLIFFSYLSLFTKVGILILWLHLWADTFTSLARGFGFIKDSGSDKEYFVHVSGLNDQVRENDEVTFDLQEGNKGLNAVNVKLA